MSTVEVAEHTGGQGGPWCWCEQRLKEATWQGSEGRGPGRGAADTKALRQ